MSTSLTPSRSRGVVFLSILFALVWSRPSSSAQPQGYLQLREQAEQEYQAMSYAKALERYAQAAALDLTENEARWVEFRIADCRWRDWAASPTPDQTIPTESRTKLESLIAAIQRPSDRDLVWAEANESLGDFWLQQNRNWYQGWSNYERALDWWAGSTELSLARQRYLGIVRKLARPSWQPERYDFAIGRIPIGVLRNALDIAEPQEQRFFNYLLARSLAGQAGTLRQRAEVFECFEKAIEVGRSEKWYDDALYAYGMWLESQGRVIPLEHGRWRAEPDFPGAVAVYRRLLKEFRKGESQYLDNARNQIKQITDPQVVVGVTNFFLPGSEVQYTLDFRNVNRIDLTLHEIDLLRDLDFREGPFSKGPASVWAERAELDTAPVVARWSLETEDQGEHRPGRKIERLEQSLKSGAYVLEATAGGQSARELILVTDAALVVKSSPDRTLVYAAQALDGSPLPDAQVRFWAIERARNNRWSVTDRTLSTNDQGLCQFEGDFGDAYQFVVAKAGDTQTIAVVNQPGRRSRSASWKIYAFTDRPAYRPEETVQWKFIARQRVDDAFSTPAGETVRYRITDQRGTKVAEGTVTLNDFGSAFGELELSSSMILGEYSVLFTDEKDNELGSATLFRLEEYKLPEFRVRIETSDPQGGGSAYRLGELVQAEVVAEYYFGGPVANAAVEAVIYQKPFRHSWSPPREFPWCYESPRFDRWYGPGQEVQRQSLVTDEQGRAIVRFETPEYSPQDLEYRIDARVTDAARREIAGSDRVRVTAQRYFVYLRAKNKLYRPRDTVQIDVKALDANDKPIAASGTVFVSRERWREVWIDPTGREISGEEYDRLRRSVLVFPPVPPDGGWGWQLKFRGYEAEEILERSVRTDAQGDGRFAFTPEKDGFYRITWRSPDTLDAEKTDQEPLRDWITAETMVWVSTESTTTLGYHQGGIEIIADRDTFKVGETAPVMIVTPDSGHHVLFTVEGESLYSARVVELTGNVKLIEVPIGEEHIPNVFLNATMLSNAQLLADQEEIVVPPLRQYLDVEVSADRSEYQPGETGTLQVTTTDADGRPVRAELSIGLVDESIYAIQDDYAGDPRSFFFAGRQPQRVTTRSTVQERPFVMLVKKDEQAIDGNAPLEADDELAVRERLSGGRAGAAMARGGLAMDSDSIAATAAPAMEMANGVGVSAKLGRAAEMAPAGAPAVGGGEEPAVQVRSDFRSTILWLPDVITDEDGTATVEVTYADSLTSWRATSRGATTGNQFGMGSAVTRTKKPLIARLQAPRFFVVGDTVTLSGVFNNNTDAAMTVTPTLEASGLTMLGRSEDGKVTNDAKAALVIGPQSEARVDWQVQVEEPGEATVTLTARSADKVFSDGMVKTYPIADHGIEKFLATSAKLRGDDVTLRLDIPAARRADSTQLVVQVTPSLAVTMLDALPYLIDYPYGCTEQTMSRFLPAAITARTLRDLGLDPEQAMGRVFGGVERRFAAKTHPKGQKNLAELDAMITASLDRLSDMQHGDGGWGWWTHDESDRFMSSYVLWGLSLAKSAGIEVDETVLARGASYVNEQLIEEEFNPDRQAWMLHALAVHHEVMKAREIDPLQAKALENLFEQRGTLNAYTRALLTLSAHHYQDGAKAEILIDNLINGVQRDERPDQSVIVRGATPGATSGVVGTAHWGEDGVWWRWSDGGVEATAFALQALLAVHPDHELVEPVTNWLIKNRRGAQWSNTRDTAIVVLTMNDYLRRSDELETELDYELLVNDKIITTQTIGKQDLLRAPARFAIEPQLVADGRNEIRVRRTRGEGPLYVSAEATFFSEEVPIPAAGNEIFVRRDYYKLVPTPTLLKGSVSERVHMSDEDYVTSGERVEVVLTVDTKNNYEYLVFEDLKPAGLEAAEVKSGQRLFARELRSGTVARLFDKQDGGAAPVDAGETTGDWVDYTGRQQWVHQELRDRKVALFIGALPQGIWELRYEMRAEVPGHFHALPVLGHAMYVPEIRCNGEEVRMTVEDR